MAWSIGGQNKAFDFDLSERETETMQHASGSLIMGQIRRFEFVSSSLDILP